jgi:hypothetical protein
VVAVQFPSIVIEKDFVFHGFKISPEFKNKEIGPDMAELISTIPAHVWTCATDEEFFPRLCIESDGDPCFRGRSGILDVDVCRESELGSPKVCEAMGDSVVESVFPKLVIDEEFIVDIFEWSLGAEYPCVVNDMGKGSSPVPIQSTAASADKQGVAQGNMAADKDLPLLYSRRRRGCLNWFEFVGGIKDKIVSPFAAKCGSWGEAFKNIESVRVAEF